MFRAICSVAIAATLAVGAQSALAAQPSASRPPALPDPAKVELPDLSRPPTTEDEKDFDKYYYFHRANTTFEQALADIHECDGYARGLASPYGYQQVYSPTMAGALGGAIGNAMVAMIFGSAELRKARRTNMRRCMNYKGYDRYGANKDLWQKFNFEEGLKSVDEDDRQRMLAQQAKVASLVTPVGRALGR